MVNENEFSNNIPIDMQQPHKMLPGAFVYNQARGRQFQTAVKTPVDMHIPTVLYTCPKNTPTT